MPSPFVRISSVASILALAGVWAGPWPTSPASAETASPWHDAYNSRVRLVAGSDGGKILAGVVIEMTQGWKTYWRHPGDSGGVPPNFDWSKSDNVQSAVVLYPAPQRLKDAAGDAIGYLDHVVYPVRVVAADTNKPVRLTVQLEYGICKEICVPVEADLTLELPAGPGTPSAEAAAALEQVPRVASLRRPTDPLLKHTEARLDGAAPRLVIDAEFPGGIAGADAFIEASEGVYVPQPVALGDGQGIRRSFVVDLRTGVDPAELKGKRLTLTLVGDAGSSEVHWQLD